VGESTTTPNTKQQNIMTTLTAHIASLTASFRRLSASRRAALKRQAAQVPAHMQDASNFWRGLSARQVLAS
jgi:hypothetical protein